MENQKMTDAWQVLREALCGEEKSIPSHYFYDAAGSRIFRAIMRLPEYYLTDCEYEILNTHKTAILDAIKLNERPLNLVDLGAGDGYKAKVLIDCFLAEGQVLTYRPVDVSGSALTALKADLLTRFPDLLVKSHHQNYAQYFAGAGAKSASQGANMLLFLGSNIGNFEPNEARAFLHQMKNSMQMGDVVLLGFDLKKHPEVIARAYNDSQGITRDFNLNLLTHLNHLLEADFDLEAFCHHPVYNPANGRAESFLVSMRRQQVHIKAMNINLQLEAWEPIHTEVSQKYDLNMIEQLAQQTGFRLVENFFDQRRYFVNSLWRKEDRM